MNNDEYYKVYDIEGNELVLYLKNHNTYVVNCFQVNEIDVEIGRHAICFKDLPVHISVKNATDKVFLNHEGIIRKTSSRVSCLEEEQINRQIIFGDKVITRTRESLTGTVYSITNVENKKINSQRITLSMNNISVYNFKHFDGIDHDVDYTRINTNGLTHADGRFFSMEPAKEIQDNFSSKIKNIIDYIKSNWFMFKIIFLTFMSIILVTVIGITVYSIYMKCIESKTKQVNLMEGFLTKEVNNLTRPNINVSLDDVTKNFLEKIEKQKRDQILNKYN